MACKVSSVARRSAHGPSSPKSVIAVTTAPGLSALSRAGGSARAISLCGDHRITSAAPIVAVSSSGRVATTEVEPAARNWKSAPSPRAEPECDQRRSGSPLGSSIRRTAAPPSASNLAQ